MKSVSFITLGCKINQYETEQLAKKLSSDGYKVLSSNDKSDVCIINTCTVTSTADQKSRQMIRRMRRKNRDAFIIVTGCYATTDYEKIKEMEEVDMVVKNESKEAIPSIIKERFPVKGDVLRRLPSFHTRYFMKVEDGCDRICTFCKIPFARGRQIKSKDITTVKEEISHAVNEGFKEVVLCGVNIGRYGVDMKDTSLVKLIDKSSQIKGLQRLRMSSIDVNDVNGRLVDTIISNEKFCHHLHLSIQSGDDMILQKMGRRYGHEEILSLVQKLRESDPLFSFSVDIIVGFPGETEEMFFHTVNLIKKILPTRVHIFRYSPRVRTAASRWEDDCPAIEKRKRMEYLKEVKDELARKYAERHIGRTDEVLVEKNANGESTGLNRYYVPTVIDSSIPRNTMVKCRIVGLKDNTNVLKGKIERC